ncbi:hypothetical protein [Peptoniphilus asaccharolyticus]
MNLKDELKSKLKNAFLGEPKFYTTQLASYEQCQLELEYAFKKSGNINNVTVTGLAKTVDEKENSYDPNAIAVYLYNVKIGYFYMNETETYRSLKNKETPIIRLYEYNGLYRAELTVKYRD